MRITVEGPFKEEFKMKKIIAIFLCAAIFAMLSLPISADDGENVITDTELVSAEYRPESDDYSVIIAWGYGFKNSDGEIDWYYVFAPTILTADIFTSDGSQAADELLAAVKERKPIPARTMVELVPESEDGLFILESYPPQLVGYSEVKFLGGPLKDYSLTDEAVRKEIDGINSMRSFDAWFSYPDGSYQEAELEVGGRTYRLDRDTMVLFEIDPDADIIEKASDLAPWGSVEYVRIDDDTLAVRPKGSDGGWSVFSAVESEKPAEQNPKTGRSGPLTGVALAGALAWCAAVAFSRKDR